MKIEMYPQIKKDVIKLLEDWGYEMSWHNVKSEEIIELFADYINENYDLKK